MRPIVLPYIHNVSHGAKKIAGKRGIPVGFSAPKKTRGLCAKISKTAVESISPCDMPHETRYAERDKEVVYNIPLKRGRKCIGQTERRISTRLRENANTCDQITHPGNLAAHCHY